MDITTDSARRRRRSLPVLQRRALPPRPFGSMTETDAATGLAVITATEGDEVIQADGWALRAFSRRDETPHMQSSLIDRATRNAQYIY